MQLHIREKQAGFTLLEMMVVISLLAATAYVATGAYTGFIEDSQEQLVYSEMQEIAAAIRQFKQDTGYYPKTGPFALGTLAETTTKVTDADLSDVRYDGTLYSGLSSTTRSNWFNSPANLYQLLYGPLLSDHVSGLESWNAETGRGWRGPYLTGIRDGFVDVVAGDNPLDTSVTTRVPDVAAIADPFTAPHITTSVMDWKRQPDGTVIEKWGRPYLFIELTTDVWSLISMGPDGDYDDGVEDLSDPDDEDNDNIIITFE